MAAFGVNEAGNRRDHAAPTRLAVEDPDFAAGNGSIQAGNEGFEAAHSGSEAWNEGFEA